MFPLGLFLIFMAAVISIVIYRFKKASKKETEFTVQDSEIVPVEDIFEDLDIKSEEPKVKAAPKKEIKKKVKPKKVSKGVTTTTKATIKVTSKPKKKKPKSK